MIRIVLWTLLHVLVVFAHVNLDLIWIELICLVKRYKSLFAIQILAKVLSKYNKHRGLKSVKKVQLLKENGLFASNAKFDVFPENVFAVYLIWHKG